MDRREIFFANITVFYKNKQYVIPKIVYKAKKNGLYSNLKELKKYSIKEPVKVLDIDVIASLGYESKIAAEQNN